MRLRDMSSDQILALLEQRMERYADLQEEEKAQEARHDAFGANLYAEFRGKDMSVEDARRALWTVEDYRDSDAAVREARSAALKAKMAVERARAALELYRTERADMRSVT